MRKRALFVGELFSEIGYDVQLTSCWCPPTTGEAWKKISCHIFGVNVSIFM